MGGEPLCPSPKVWRLGLIAWLYDRIIIHLEARRQSVPCPQCGVKSSRVHSRYRRRASDLALELLAGPIGGSHPQILR